MKTLLFSIAILFSCFCFSTPEYKGGIKGTVSDKINYAPLIGASVLLTENNTGTITNATGNFKITSVPSGKYSLQIFYLGYTPVKINVEIGDEMIDLNVTLNRQNINLKEVVIKATDVNDIHLIQSIDIRNYPVNSSQDLLKIVPGLNIAQHAGGGKSEQMFLRGFDLDHGTDISINVDNMPVNMLSHAHGQGYTDLHFVIPETVDKIIVNKGPHSAHYGNLATAGSVHLLTKTKIDNSLLKLEVGNYGTIRSLMLLDLIPNEKKESESFYIASEYVYREGYFDLPQNFNRLNIFSKYSKRLSPKSLINVSASVFNSRWRASGQIPERAVEAGLISRFGAIDEFEGGNTSRYNLQLEWIKIFNGLSSLKQNMYISNYNFNLFSNFTFFASDSINGDRIKQAENRMIYGYKAVYDNNYEVVGKNIKFELAGGVRIDDIDNLELSSVKDRSEILSYKALGDASLVNYYAFTTHSFEICKKLKVTAAMRFDNYLSYYKDFINEKEETQHNSALLSPKLSFYYHLNDNSLVFIKSSVGHHTNDVRSINNNSSLPYIPKAYGVDAGSEFKIGDRFYFVMTLWTLIMEDELVYVGDEAIVESSGRTERKGVELSMRSTITKSISIDNEINYTHARGDGTEGNNYVPLAPVWSSDGGITYNDGKHFRSSLRYRWMADRPANEDNSLIAKGHFLADVLIAYNFSKWEVGTVVENIFNVDWYETQFETTSQLKNETEPVSEIHFTPGTPVFIKGFVTYSF
ncbi:MAG: TonB-dependent receptor [Bacteroidia bacterium]